MTEFRNQQERDAAARALISPIQPQAQQPPPQQPSWSDWFTNRFSAENALNIPYNAYALGSNAIGAGIRGAKYFLDPETAPHPTQRRTDPAASMAAFDAAGLVATGGIGATAAARAAGRPMVPKGAIGANALTQFDKSILSKYNKKNLEEIARELGANLSNARSRAQIIDAIERRRTEKIRSYGKNAEATHDTTWATDKFVPTDIASSQKSAASQFDVQISDLIKRLDASPQRSNRLSRDSRGTEKLRHNNAVSDQLKKVPGGQLKAIADYFDAPVGRTRVQTINNIFDGDITPDEVIEAIKYIQSRAGEGS